MGVGATSKKHLLINWRYCIKYVYKMILKLKKWWKKRPSWLKGGILSIGLITITFVVFLMIETITNFISPCQDCFARTPFGYIALILVLVPASWIELIGINQYFHFLKYFYIPFSILTYFLIGALIGWIDNKIKKNK